MFIKRFFSNVHSITTNIIYRFHVLNFIGINLLDMATVERHTLATLIARLEKAERRMKVLHCEIKDIKEHILDIKRNQDVSNSNGLQTSTSSFLNITSSTNEAVASTSKRYNETDGANASGVSAKRLRYDFRREGDYVIVYTDGACENNGKANAKAGIGVWWDNEHALNVSEPVKGRPTNNTAEIQACVRAIDVALECGVTKLIIKTDSQFVINSITQWIKKWKKNNWKVASGGDVKNKEDFQKLDNACSKLQSVKWEYVAGHAGHLGNEAADRLARAGALRYVK